MNVRDIATYEFRRVWGGRGGRALLVLTCVLPSALAIVGAVIQLATDDPRARIAPNSAVGLASLAAILLPSFCAIVVLTKEWSTRSGVLTFALIPARSRLLAGKLLVCVGALLLAQLSAVGSAFLGVITVGAASGRGVAWRGAWGGEGGVWTFISTSTLNTLLAVALSMLITSTTAAVVVWLLASLLLEGILLVLPGGVAPWLSFQLAVDDLARAQLDYGRTGQIVAVLILWLVIPGGLGLWRFTSREAP